MKKKSAGLFFVAFALAVCAAVAVNDVPMLEINEASVSYAGFPGSVLVTVFTNQNATCHCDFEEKCYGMMAFSMNDTGKNVHNIGLSAIGNGTHTLYIACRNDTSLDTSYTRLTFSTEQLKQIDEVEKIVARSQSEEQKRLATFKKEAAASKDLAVNQTEKAQNIMKS